MLPACFHLADNVFPRVKAEAGRQLVASGKSQKQVADALGVSQAMVSKYNAKAADADPLVLRLAQDLVQEVALGTGTSNAWCEVLTADDAGHDALSDLLSAERQLLAAAPTQLVPQVGLNIARALPDADAVGDVLAYPARIVAAGDRLVAPVAPSLGASNHLAQCLLALRTRDPSIHAIANIAGVPVDAPRLAGEGDRAQLFADVVASAPHTPLLIHDPGAIGIEPCLYVAGADAQAVVQTILEIAKEHP